LHVEKGNLTRDCGLGTSEGERKQCRTMLDGIQKYTRWTLPSKGGENLPTKGAKKKKKKNPFVHKEKRWLAKATARQSMWLAGRAGGEHNCVERHQCSWGGRTLEKNGRADKRGAGGKKTQLQGKKMGWGGQKPKIEATTLLITYCERGEKNEKKKKTNVEDRLSFWG